MRKKGIVSFDLDMTLLNHADWTIPPSARRAIAALRENYLIAIASGRDMDHAYSCKFKDQIKPDAIIHLNGTKVSIGDRIIFEHFMDQKLVERMMIFAKDKPYSIGIAVGADDYFINPQYVVEHDIARWRESNRHFKDPRELLNLKIQTLTYIGKQEGAREIEAAFPELKLLMFASYHGADVVEKIVSKADGLKRLCDYYHIPIANTFAFGDSMNDYEIIRAAGVGIAMGNASDTIKEAADYVTDRIDQDGIYKACLELGLIKLDKMDCGQE